MIKIKKIWFKKFFIFVKFFKILKIREFIFIKSGKLFSFLFFNVYNEKMFTIEIEDGRPKSLVNLKSYL